MMKEVTREDFYKKYGDCEVKFLSYYKFTFTYSCKAQTEYGEVSVYVDCGGDSDQIYRYEVSNDGIESICSLQPFAGEVYDKNNKLVESFYDY